MCNDNCSLSLCRKTCEWKMNFSEVLKQSNQLCKVSPNGKYLASIWVFVVISVMQEESLIHICRFVASHFLTFCLLMFSGNLRTVPASGPRCWHPANPAAVHLFGSDIPHGVVLWFSLCTLCNVQERPGTGSLQDKLFIRVIIWCGYKLLVSPFYLIQYFIPIRLRLQLFIWTHELHICDKMGPTRLLL